MSQPNNRSKNERIGRLAERFAIFYMLVKGYRPLKLRYKCKAGEIDLILKRGKHIIFCEVKYRRDRQAILYSVTPTQKKRIRQAAEFWLAQNNIVRHNIRFDFIGLTLWQKPIHIKNAF